MLKYILRRSLISLVTIVIISVISFVLIQLPPGDFLDMYVANLEASGAVVDQSTIQALEEAYGLNQPLHVQYGKWVWRIVTRGDFGKSMLWYGDDVSNLIWERLWLTLLLSLASMLIIWVIAFPVGVYSALRQYSPGDYFFTFISFVGVGLPNFLIALVIMWFAYDKLGMQITGLFSREFDAAPWSLAKVGDMLNHMWIPVLVIAMGGTAGLIRIMRANMLDELHKPYVATARAKGVKESKVIVKYPVRVALNPFISTVGWTLPGLVSGSIIVSVVLNLPTTGPLLLSALKGQDMYLAGTFILLLSVLTVVGTLLSDILLALNDPRIRLE